MWCASRGCFWSASEQLSCEVEPGCRVRCRHEAVMADLDEARRQNVTEPARQKRLAVESHCIAVLGTERDPTLIDGHQSMVRQRDAMRILPQIANHLLWAAKGSLAVNDPILAIQPGHDDSEILRIVGSQSPAPSRSPQRSEQLAAKESSQ